jgi:hypothetical protein
VFLEKIITKKYLRKTKTYLVIKKEEEMFPPTGADRCCEWE